MKTLKRDRCVKRAGVRSARALRGGLGLGMATILGMSGLAAAQDSSLALQQFAPQPGGNLNFVTVGGTGTPGHLRPMGGLYLNYAHRPLVFTYASGESIDLVRHQVQGDILASLGLGNAFMLGLGLPVTVYQAAGDLGDFAAPPLDAFVLGDVRLMPKWRVTPATSNFGLALQGTITLPTGNPEAYQGNDGVTFTPQAFLELKANDKLRMGANLGYLIRSNPQGVYDLQVGSELTYGLAAAYRTSDKLSFIGELYGRVGTSGEIQSNVLPLELGLAARYRSSSGHTVTIGGGPGLTSGYGTPLFRLYLGYYFDGAAAPNNDTDGDTIVNKMDKCPKDPEDIDSFQDEDGCPDPDNDGDGILDADDKCVNDAEDKDDFKDTDGCPDPDNDGDGVVDTKDKCPTTLEDKDGFDDDDGCPDPDNDADGIPDATDQCPNKPEDKDNLGDNDGCPEKDFDRDGVADEVDKCPDQPEVINGVDDLDGCPDQGKSKVKLSATKIEILDKVYFDTGKATIQTRSFDLLSQVAAILKANPEITLVEIEGHTDDVGNDAANMKLSQDRTESVRKFLMDKGIEQSRLAAKGYGETKPVVPNTNNENRALNRRVEFRISEVNGKPVGEGGAVIEREVPVEK